MNAGTRIATALSFVAALAMAAVPAAAQAQTNSATACGASLVQLEDSRIALEGLQLSVETAKTDLAGLEARAGLLVEMLLVTDAKGERATLHAEAKRVDASIASITMLLPAIETQADALAADVDAVERAYLRCVETMLDAD